MPKGDSVRAALKAKVGAGGVDFQVYDTSTEVKDLRGDLNKKKKPHTLRSDIIEVNSLNGVDV